MNQENPAHWCRNVVEQVQENPLKTLSAPGQLMPAGYPTPTANYSNQYPAADSASQQYYANYYNYYASYYQQQQQLQMQQHLQTAQPNIAVPQRPTSYASALISGLPQPIPPTASTSVYNPPIALPPAQLIQNIPKKPNPTRFATTVTAPSAATAPQATEAKPAQATNGSRSGAMPPALKLFVQRSFDRCVDDGDRVFMESALKKIISKISADDRLAIHKWDLEPSPIPPSERRQKANIITSGNSTDYSTTVSSTKPQDGSNSNSNEESPRKRKSRFSEEARPVVSVVSMISIPTSTAMSAYGSSVTSTHVADDAMKSKRANRFQSTSSSNDTQTQAAAASTTPSQQGSSKKKKTKYAPVVSSADHSSSMTEFDIENLIVTGTCQKVDKEYFRLTSAPDPSTVRPEHILKKSLEYVKKRWEEDKNTPEKYISICSQFKSIRQDLTVQHIRNDFTVLVYETHARIALLSGDLNEYNQCQTQLKHFYMVGLGGSELEFTAYRILYYLSLQGNKKYQSGSSDLVHIMQSLSSVALSDSAVMHALEMRQAFMLDNYHRFFKLYKLTPNLGTAILGNMIDPCRVRALQRMLKSYSPMPVSASFVVQELGFATVDEGLAFLRKGNLILTADATDFLIDTKNSVIDMAKVFTQDKLLM